MIDGSMVMMEETVQVHNNSQKRLYLPCITNVRVSIQCTQNSEYSLVDVTGKHDSEDQIARSDEKINSNKDAPFGNITSNFANLTREKQYKGDTRSVNGSNNEISLSSIAFMISPKEQEREEEAEMSKDEDDKA
ncbi:hypothetical protein RFI_30156 [Reticulomyxa filosa]|uniref:Uncharacterized protein n=1 Tax=Reticulomyxa filosa TaxID=46433 RepID=X6M1D6_RETFI|nr:hypothetical protein RFI_30156 [Reticulomyxa filosa]|eukprot:ETO07237.1 hypothetical protein RFI_30156 [Reticulomyxa filosa]